MRRRGAAVALALTLVLIGAACSSSKQSGSTTATTRGSATPSGCPVAPVVAATLPNATGSIRVLAAASLNKAFADVAAHFETKFPGTKIDFSFGASSSLVNQVIAGAPADVIATADGTTMTTAVNGGAAKASQVFTCNRLALIVPKGNPKHVTSLQDLGRSGVSFILCAEPVPCGKYARQALATATVTAQPKGSEQDATAVVTKVGLGEADAGVAYVTDAESGTGKVDAVALPANQQVLAAYPIAVAAKAGNQPVAQLFVSFVQSSEGRQILASHGFITS